MKKLSLLHLTCIALIFSANLSFAQDRVTGHQFATRSEVIAVHGMAATSQPLATQAALDILKAGGTAVDAAIAANALLGLVEPTGCGIGGDLFALVWDSGTSRLYGLNASGRSPHDLSLQYFLDNGYQRIPAYGPLPVSVPGCVDGWFELHRRFGKLPAGDLFASAIKYAREGFPVTELIAYYMALSAKRLQDYPGFREVFMPGGRTPAKGEIFRNPALADTYEKIAEGGRDAFYSGEIASVMVDYIREQGGFLSLRDLEDHRSEWVEPVSTSYRGYDVWEIPPNGQGIAALQMLNILEQYDIREMGFGSADYIHVFTEAKKLAFEDRARYYADPDFSDVPVDALISKSYARQRMALIDMTRASAGFVFGEPEPGNTIYLTVADQWGSMVSLIQSNYRGMGSGMTPPGLGFILQDRGELFSLDPAHPNVYAPHKRPFHTIIPGFITKDGKPWISFGVMGGDMQPQGHVQIVVNLVDFGMNLQEAGDAPRIQHFGSTDPTGTAKRGSGWICLESGINYEVIRDLMMRGQDVRFDLGGYGGYQAIMWDPVNGVYYGASESRKDGQAAGY